MKRIEVFQKMVSEGGNQRIARLITEAEFDEVVAFIEDREDLDIEKFADAIRGRTKGGSIWVAELLWNLVHEMDCG